MAVLPLTSAGTGAGPLRSVQAPSRFTQEHNAGLIDIVPAAEVPSLCGSPLHSLTQLLPPPLLPPCRFLSLAGNRIRAVENLQDLQDLQFLDLSQNRIETLDPGRSGAGSSLRWTGSDARGWLLFRASSCLFLIALNTL